MEILISNDDGVYADGIKNLRKSLSQIANVTVVAPLEERSTTGHTLTLDHPLRLVELEEDVYGCSGYPADCALYFVKLKVGVRFWTLTTSNHESNENHRR